MTTQKDFGHYLRDLAATFHEDDESTINCRDYLNNLADAYYEFWDLNAEEYESVMEVAKGIMPPPPSPVEVVWDEKEAPSDYTVKP